MRFIPAPVNPILKSIILLSLLVGFLGCESAEDRQRHLFNLQQCIVATNEADKATWADDPDLMKQFSPKERQGQHDYRAAQCMAFAEKTTIEFQDKKHDNYGKCAY